MWILKREIMGKLYPVPLCILLLPLPQKGLWFECKKGVRNFWNGTLTWTLTSVTVGKSPCSFPSSVSYLSEIEAAPDVWDDVWMLTGVYEVLDSSEMLRFVFFLLSAFNCQYTTILYAFLTEVLTLPLIYKYCFKIESFITVHHFTWHKKIQM